MSCSQTWCHLRLKSTEPATQAGARRSWWMGIVLGLICETEAILGFCFTGVSMTVIKRHGQKQLGEERVYLPYISRVIVH